MKRAMIHELFSQTAGRCPASPALVSAERTVSYLELDQGSDRLAGFLQAQNLLKGAVVGLLLEDRTALIESMLGVLKAGASFLPLHPGTPDARLSHMLEQARPCWIVTDSGSSARLTALSGIEAVGRLFLDNSEYTSRTNARPAQPEPDPDGLCYVFFTSGSTGRPKGIGGRLKAIDHFVRWEVETFNLDFGPRVSQLTLPMFDAFLRDVFVPLCTGGTVCIPGDEERSDPARMISWLDRQRVELVHCVPSLLRAWLNAGLGAANFSTLRLILLAGEPMLPADVKRWREIFQDRVQLVNLYGPSETTMTKFFHVLRPEDANRSSIPIGKPMRGASAIVVDANHRPCPPGAVGEILIRTPFRTLGYIGQPELTQKVFIPNPFGSDPSDLVYKTGDLARILPDGTFELLGRMDHQVKVRGVRIELPEIESILRDHPAVRDVAVIDRDDPQGDKYLCAYVVLADGAGPEDLRSYAVRHLPDYMTPSVFLPLEVLPRTPNGKIDRSELPLPAEFAAQGRDSLTAPRNALEELLAGIWSNLLGIDPIGIHDNFFQLGGHSLLATQLASRIREVLGTEIGLRPFFHRPTVGGLAEQVAEALRHGEVRQAPPIQRVPRTGDLPLSFAQRRQWFLEQMHPGEPNYNIVSAVRVRGPLQSRVLAKVLREIVLRHEVLRTTFPIVRSEPVQRIRSQVDLQMRRVDLAGLPESLRQTEARRTATDSSSEPFDLENGPLLRSDLLILGEEDHVVLLTMHHIVTDAWSRSVLIREMGALYDAFSRDQPSPLPELPVQYADFAVWEQQWLRGEVLEFLYAYWKHRLAPPAPPLSLPFKVASAPAGRQNGSHTFAVPRELAARLRELSRREGSTLFMTLLAAFKVLLFRLTGQQDIVVGAPVAGRSTAEVEGLIGYFINALALRTDLSGNPSFLALLARVRETLLEAYTHQDLPFDKFVEMLRQEHRRETYKFEVTFNFQNVPNASLTATGLTFDAFELEPKFAKYGLTLYMREQGEDLLGTCVYATDFADAVGIGLLVKGFLAVLDNVVLDPERRLQDLDLITDEHKREQKMKERERPPIGLKALGRERKVVKVSAQQVIRTEYLSAGQTLPLAIKPNAENVDLVSWAQANRAFIEQELLRHGAILFRGFGLSTVEDFDRLSRGLIPSMINYVEGSSPRIMLNDKIYTSTEYPAEHQVSMHNELSYAHKWPAKILFYCLQPPQDGGETPIADSRKVYDILPPEVRDAFMRHGVRYLRNLHDGQGPGLSWQSVFETDDRAFVERYCWEGDIQFAWQDNGKLKTDQLRPAVIAHPQTGERVWFNQVHQFHPSNLGREVMEALLATTPEEELPIHAALGNHTPFPPEMLEAVREAYDQTMVRFPWERGDAMLLDNMLVAHGRMPFTGPRKILVSMGETFRLKDLSSAEGIREAEPA